MMWSNLDDENTSRAVEFITDWSRLSWHDGMAAKQAFTLSRHDSTKDTTNDWRTDRDTDRWILLSWRSTAMQENNFLTDRVDD